MADLDDILPPVRTNSISSIAAACRWLTIDVEIGSLRNANPVDPDDG